MQNTFSIAIPNRGIILFETVCPYRLIVALRSDFSNNLDWWFLTSNYKTETVALNQVFHLCEIMFIKIFMFHMVGTSYSVSKNLSGILTMTVKPCGVRALPVFWSSRPSKQIRDLNKSVKALSWYLDNRYFALRC
jgi:hypothetical protein